MKETYLLHAAIPYSHTPSTAPLYQKYTDLKEDLTRIWQLNAVCVVPLGLSTMDNIPETTPHFETAQSPS
jgi:hypothetical protein